MVRLQVWQWGVLALPIALVVGTVLVAASWQIHEWGLSWIWAVFLLLFVGWRWLLGRWTKPALQELETAVESINQDLQTASTAAATSDLETTRQAEAFLQQLLQESQNDLPLWEDWPTFGQRAQALVTAIAHLYYPDVKYPLLNIYVPQAYTLIRGTVDDLDQWMQKLSPALNQVTLGQAVQAYDLYRQLQPSARKLLRVWNWAQWVLNPVAAAARSASSKYSSQANQQLLVNLSQLLREAALRTLCQRAIALYSGSLPALATPSSSPELQVKTQSLRDILAAADPPEAIAQTPLNLLLVGRTGAGKSSLINTLFQSPQAQVDALPSTTALQRYDWQTTTGDTLSLWDSPGYEQINAPELRQAVLDYAARADLLLLVTPALDPALQMDLDFLQAVKTTVANLPAIAIVTQVDRLRPLREWEPPYDWQWGDRPKEVAIREATAYRAELLGDWCDRVLPVVTADAATGRQPWNIGLLSLTLLEAIAPAQQLRLARFLSDLDSRSVAAARLIDRYTMTMTTTQGLTALLKSPLLQFMLTWTTGTPALAPIVATQVPVEQGPVVVGKLQLAYELHQLLAPPTSSWIADLQALWPLLLNNPNPPERNAWAFGRTLMEYWTQQLPVDQLGDRFEQHLGDRSL